VSLTEAHGPRIGNALSFKAWLLCCVAGVTLLLVAIGGFNFYVDPFQQYRLSTRYPPRFYDRLHRYIDPGLAKNASYDTLLTGSSINENTVNSVTDSACGGRAINVAMPAITAYEQQLIVRTALRARHLKRVILVLDFNAFSGSPTFRQAAAGVLPEYLYDSNPLNDLPYVLSMDTLVKSLRIVTADHSERFSTNTDAPWWWGDLRSFSRSEVLKGLDPEDLNARYQQPQRDLAGMEASFDENLLPLFKPNPGVEFDIVWPPYSIIVWLDFAQRHQLDLTLRFKRYVWETTRDLPNVRVVDVQGLRATTHDLDSYTDAYHYAPAVNNFVVRAACSRDHLVDQGNIDALEKQLRAQVSAFDLGSAILDRGPKSSP
jgi:hypothetical protein